MSLVLVQDILTSRAIRWPRISRGLLSNEKSIMKVARQWSIIIFTGGANSVLITSSWNNNNKNGTYSNRIRRSRMYQRNCSFVGWLPFPSNIANISPRSMFTGKSVENKQHVSESNCICPYSAFQQASSVRKKQTHNNKNNQNIWNLRERTSPPLLSSPLPPSASTPEFVSPYYTAPLSIIRYKAWRWCGKSFEDVAMKSGDSVAIEEHLPEITFSITKVVNISWHEMEMSYHHVATMLWIPSLSRNSGVKQILPLALVDQGAFISFQRWDGYSPCCILATSTCCIFFSPKQRAWNTV